MHHYFARSYYYLDTFSLPYLKGIGVGHGGDQYFWDNQNRKDNMIVLQYTLKGTGYFEIDTQRSLQKIGSFFLAEIPSDCRYYGREDWQFIYLEFSKEILQWFYPTNQVHHDSSAVFQDTITEIVTQLQEKSEVPFFENTHLTYALVLAIKKELLSKRMKKYPLAQEIKGYLEQQYQEELGLADIEKQFGISKYKAIRVFEKAYALSPMAYLKKYRVKRSLPFLIDGQRTIHEIAQLVGMANGNYFAKVFKAEVGMAPSDYQKSKQTT
ncbi:AraC family transcriptional regulator [Enterococcus gilvus]|uniref:helix-turn-helix domain-containing protein n=1 Tax=Enterococcus gilvus TaxID=160453 RepID=UPI003D6A30F2